MSIQGSDSISGYFMAFLFGRRNDFFQIVSRNFSFV